MKFSKYNNPNRKRKSIKRVSQSYKAELDNQLYALLAKCETEEQKDAIIKAYRITLNP